MKSQLIQLSGQLKGLIYKDGYKLKYIKLEVENREYWLKIPKQQRSQFEQLNSEGLNLRVIAEVERCRKTGKISLKAQEIEIINPNQSPEQSAPSQKATSASILICQKSSCWQKGGAAIYAQIRETLSQAGLAEQVKIKTTGCLKKCKQGPNLVFMPDRAHYSSVTCQELPQLLAQHISR